MKKFRNPQNVHEPAGPYIHQIEVKGNERMLVISGQVGMKEDGTVPEDPHAQLEVAFDNVIRNLHAANMDVEDLIKINWYFVDEIDPDKRREMLLPKLKDHRTCSTLIYVAGLASPAYRVEVEAWASRAD